MFRCTIAVKVLEFLKYSAIFIAKLGKEQVDYHD